MRINVKEICGKHTVTRSDGKKIHAIIMRHWDDEEPIEIDFGNIMIASVSFMDESIGILGLNYSKDEIVRKIKLKNITDQDKKLLSDIVLSRLRQQKQKVA